MNAGDSSGGGGVSAQFPPGTFAPDPRPATLSAMLSAQSRLELVLMLRHGEQLLLTMFIPITLLVGLTLLPIGTMDGVGVDRVIPGVMALGVMSTAFTGQAIAVGFDRRYGALKRLAATALPTWAILAGKIVAVTGVVLVQSLVLGGIAAALGWRPGVTDLATGAVVIAVGTAAFAALGLALGGSLRAEIVLALANIIWFVLLGVGGIILANDELPAGVRHFAQLTPSGALAGGLRDAVAGHLELGPLLVLAAWGAAGAAVARRTFSLT